LQCGSAGNSRESGRVVWGGGEEPSFTADTTDELLLTIGDLLAAARRALAENVKRQITLCRSADPNHCQDNNRKAFRRLGGSPRIVVLDNLREGVLSPDFYDPTLNRKRPVELSITHIFESGH